MNYKCFADEVLPISILSYFHRGFFWGITSSWIVGMSFVMGAAITKSAYIDRQDYQLASQSDLSLAQAGETTIASLYQAKLNPRNLISKSSTVRIKASSFVLSKAKTLKTTIVSVVNQKDSPVKMAKSFASRAPNKQKSRQQKQLDPALALDKPQSLVAKPKNQALKPRQKKDFFSDRQKAKPLTYVVDSPSPQNQLAKLSSAKDINHFKQHKIVILDSEKYPGLAEYVSAYLKERDFLNTEVSYVAVNQVITSSPDLTVIKANGENRKSANYLKSILGFGDLELIPSGFSNVSDSAELILLLGNDAQTFSKNQGFVSYIR